MRLLILLTIAPLLLLQVQSGACGQTNSACCPEDNFCEDDLAACSNGICKLTVPGEGSCINKGMINQECCNGVCVGENIECSSGSCVDVTDDPVDDQSGFRPGQEGGPCVGALKLCDEDEDLGLECIDNICQLPQGVNLQSVCSFPGRNPRYIHRMQAEWNNLAE
jgi:hypothetical protein